MSDGAYFGFGILAVILVVCILVLWITHEVKKGPSNKPNIRLPRQTAWDRAANYYRGDE